MTETTTEPHAIRRMRHETRRRLLTVMAVDRLTPRMLRIHFASDDFADFVSAAPDDHIKLFFPDVDPAVEGGKPVMRDFTPRAFDVAKGTLTIDFALHEAGPATQWAAGATVGQTLEIGGPRGSMVVPDDFDWYWLIGDETALPAIGRWVEQLPAGKPVLTAAVIADAGEIQSFDARADWDSLWSLRSEAGADDAAALKAALDRKALPAGDGFVWIAAESSVARALRAYVVEERGHPKVWMKASGYWKRGEADAHERIDD
ncbi:siderophore-interacting protein [Kaistia dalseonensis]|uniref:NADPH-dependent ferric siderophore reductase n=1 Tax=Kaistia dalseonensis TaxID=410840 RepID=A0ABU0H5U4_9HYPH|nr:siderophore-interacting protein [Kaistia dalseonensis]MCX5495073.1 siderophore-interacting protein [Kaistia dalseonensis]MDQ0437655.1 NADPH-dependent ferric siderophore reductase [Kaistia dalseonensis]